jgi:hypothetical protein
MKSVQPVSESGNSKPRPRMPGVFTSGRPGSQRVRASRPNLQLLRYTSWRADDARLHELQSQVGKLATLVLV